MNQLIKPKKGYKFEKWLFGKMMEIPEKWDRVRLIEQCGDKPQYGANVSAIKKNLKLPRYIRITDLNHDGSLRNEEWKSISEEDATDYILNEDDILFARTGATVGKTFLYQKNNGWCAFAGYLIRFKPDNKKLDSKFLFYWTHSQHYWSWLLSIQTHGVQPNVNAEQYSHMPLLLPPLPEQQKIAAIISAVDQLIISTQKVIDQTESLKQGLMQKLLSKGIDHKKFKKIKWLFGKEIEIPEEWEIKKINDDVFEFLTSGTNSRSDLNENDEIRYIHYGDIHTKWNLVLNCDMEKIPRIDKSKVERLPLLKDGDLIIADASEDYGGSGTSILLKNVKSKKIVAGLHTIVLRNKDKNISSDFLRYLTSIHSVKIQIISYVTGSKVYGLSKKNLKNIRVPFPSLSEQQKITRILSNVDIQIESHIQNKEKLEKLKKSLIEKLLTGEVRVKT